MPELFARIERRFYSWIDLCRRLIKLSQPNHPYKPSCEKLVTCTVREPFHEARNDP